MGYLQAVSLIASYLEVPLRYPVRLGGSRSFITDYAPSVEPASSDLLLSSSSYVNTKAVEFPLFLEGQDTTRAAYAVFLLNKVNIGLWLFPYLLYGCISGTTSNSSILINILNFLLNKVTLALSLPSLGLDFRDCIL